MIPLSQEQQDDVAMSGSVMDPPRTIPQALRDFFFGRNIADQFNNAFSGQAAGAFTVPKGTPAKGVTWFNIPGPHWAGEKVPPLKAAQGKMADLIKVFNSKGEGTLWYDPATEIGRYTDKMHEHTNLLDFGNDLNTGPKMNYGKTARARFYPEDYGLGMDVWPGDFPPVTQNGVPLSASERVSNMQRHESGNALLKMLMKHGLWREPASFGSGIDSLNFNLK